MGSCVARSTVYYSWLVWPSIRMMDKINQIPLHHKFINVKFIILLSKLSPASIWQFRPILTGILLLDMTSLLFFWKFSFTKKLFFVWKHRLRFFCHKAKMDCDNEDRIPHSKLAFTVLASVDMPIPQLQHYSSKLWWNRKAVLRNQLLAKKKLIKLWNAISWSMIAAPTS